MKPCGISGTKHSTSPYSHDANPLDDILNDIDMIAVDKLILKVNGMIEYVMQ